MIVGYASGVFDLFHVGHVNLLRNAKSLCDRLIVGVTTDDLVSYKLKRAVIPFEERIDVVRSCRYVDVVVPQASMNKREAWDRYKFDVMIVGDDWFQNDRWNELEIDFSKLGVKIVYLPYTQGTSSTLINETLASLRKL
jgi:glycerol-3-phosphate cytidylyltransferase